MQPPDRQPKRWGPPSGSWLAGLLIALLGVGAARLPAVAQEEDTQEAAGAVEAADQPGAEGTAEATEFPWLAGFDSSRLASIGRWAAAAVDPAVAPPTDEMAAGDGGPEEDRLAAEEGADSDRQRAEAARLLYQVNRLAAMQPLPPAIDQPPLAAWRPGDRVSLRGQATALTIIELPPPLADQVELKRLYLVTVAVADSAAAPASNSTADSAAGTGSSVHVLSAAVPAEWLRGGGASGGRSVTMAESTSLSGVVIAGGDDLVPLPKAGLSAAGGDRRPVRAVVATADLAWYPSSERLQGHPAAADWGLLSQHGFDLSQIAKIRSRHQRPLVAADRDGFYPLLSIADRLSAEDWQAVESVQLAKLLEDPSPWVGRRLRMRCKAIRVTRVMLLEPELESRLGSDHYWQIDALGDLEGVVVSLQSPDSAGDPAVFAGQFPVSLVSLRLPAFLAEAAGWQDGFSGDLPSEAAVRADVGKLARQVMVEGVFYRLWSYDSALMQQHGGGQQFGPLILATRIIDREPVHDPNGDLWLTAVTSGIGLGLLALFALWVWRAQRADRIARQQHRQRRLPSRLPGNDDDSSGDGGSKAAAAAPGDETR